MSEDVHRMTEVWRRLDALGATITPVPPQRVRQLIDELTSLVGPMPDDYLEVLERYGGDIELDDDDVEFVAAMPSAWAVGGADGIERMHGLTSSYGRSVFEAVAAYEGRIPPGWLPIGDAAGGNQLCLRTARGARGREVDDIGAIGFWDHEAERAVDAGGRARGLTPVATSFRAFVDLLRVAGRDGMGAPEPRD
ncbi:SMI1/KNR4 family protein [Pseudoclavibacter endophyticus]|nr:SMI1/KNR4 family protein [Pseudoclavibacter endophyticus]GGA70156.1 SMI1/KNR4 family protein [Pseudoclavibacter endophyticus]